MNVNTSLGAQGMVGVAALLAVTFYVSLKLTLFFIKCYIKALLYSSLLSVKTDKFNNYSFDA